MDVKELQKLLSAMAEADIGELSLETGDYKLLVKRGLAAADLSKLALSLPAPAPVVQVSHAAPPTPAVNAPAAPVAVSPASQEVKTPPTTSGVKKAEPTVKLIEVKAPIVGTFYASPTPDAAAFVKEGDRIQAGKVLCIIEAMKLMNEIEAEVSGTVAEILVRNEEPVEYGQVLFTIDPG